MEPATIPLVTIGIPTYNRAHGYLQNALSCALRQSYGNIEVVVSDNCSSDNTEDTVRKHDDPRIRYFRQARNIGANNNFNYCLQQARGSYFHLFHDDDGIDHDFVETCMRSAGHRTDIGIIRTGARVIDGDGAILNEFRNMTGNADMEVLFTDWFRGKAPLYLCNTLFNTLRLRELGGFGSKTNLYQDVVAAFRLAAGYGRLDIPDVKASFRRHAANMGSNARIADWSEDSLFLLDVMCDLVPARRDQIRKNGLRYFCKKNYRLASAIPSPVQRYAAYVRLYAKFRYQYSPIRFLCSRRGSRIKNLLRRKLIPGSAA